MNGTALPTSSATPIPFRDIAMTGPMNPKDIAATSMVPSFLSGGGDVVSLRGLSIGYLSMLPSEVRGLYLKWE